MTRNPRETSLEELVEYMVSTAKGGGRNAAFRARSIVQDLQEALTRQGIPRPTVGDLIASFTIVDKLKTLAVFRYNQDHEIEIKGGAGPLMVDGLQKMLQRYCGAMLPRIKEPRRNGAYKPLSRKKRAAENVIFAEDE